MTTGNYRAARTLMEAPTGHHVSLTSTLNFEEAKVNTSMSRQRDCA
jgi:hypothetical protein